ncbi:DUF1801 domain-containing protein [Mucilaginibacter sp.]|uniref:iron chaperone n=1 Tax=Mucilaginibacter sp. TaxID=1882438 RepID=UPI00260FB7CB|nr:DUF1801 domain-containing protein [Mucilaginibacter sp.]MDB5126932.1 hypothetical protein [Mucilaginibacter sp.]
MNKPKDVDEYIGSFPADVQQKLQQMRDAIKSAAPHTQEIISYGMPAYKQHGNLVYFGAAKNHLGFYPGAAVIAHLKLNWRLIKAQRVLFSSRTISLCPWI